jgi:hypothetical protein
MSGMTDAMNSVSGGANVQMFNYDEYTRYLHNLNCMYGRVDRRAEVTSIINDLGKGNRGHSLSISIGGDGQLLDEKQQDVVRDLSERCNTENQGAWIVMDLTLDVVYMSNVIPKSWMDDILPLMKREDEYIEDDFLYWKLDECDPICLTCPVAQERMVSDRYMDIISELLDLYDRGSIVGRSEAFIRDWELEADERGIYHPTWWNTLLTNGDPTLYLYNMSEGTSYKSESTDAYLRLEELDEPLV